MIEPSPLSSSLPASADMRHCQRVMARAGWEISYVDLDLSAELPKAEIKLERADGRWIWARLDAIGRCTIERFHRTRSLGMSPNGKGRRPLVPIVDDAFLGRSSYPGPRAMLREMTRYVAENALHPVSLADVRRVWAGLMSHHSHHNPSEIKQADNSLELSSPGRPRM